MTASIKVGPTDALLKIDIQNDFCPGGALEVPGGDEIVPLVNELSKKFAVKGLSQDWHPKGHKSFASSYEGKAPMDMVELDYGPQVLWPDHCVQGTEGAEFHPDLDVTEDQFVIRKGFRPGIDSYSAFYENDGETTTGLASYLRDRGVKRIFLVGLATDFCVAYSAIDGVEDGFEVYLIEDACRGIGIPNDGSEGQVGETSIDTMKHGMREAGVKIVTSQDIA